MNNNNRENFLANDLEHILNHTQDIWENFRDSRIFITGGTGFFGCWLLESFAWANYKLQLNAEAVILTRNKEGFLNKAPHLASNPAIKFHTGDVRDFKFPEYAFSHIIHAATDTSWKLKKENPLLLYNSIYEGTKRVLEFAVHCKAKNLLFISSGAVYGKQPYSVAHISEEYNGSPSTVDLGSAYGIGKRSAEHLCLLYSKKFGISIKIARCFSFIGPYLPLDGNYAIGNFIANGLSEEQIEVKGDGTPFRSYLYAADLAIWLWIILIKGKSCHPYNVGSGNEITITELATTIAKCFNSRQGIKISKLSKKNIEIERYVPAIDRAQKELGLKEYIALIDSIKRTIKWHKE